MSRTYNTNPKRVRYPESPDTSLETYTAVWVDRNGQEYEYQRRLYLRKPYLLPKLPKRVDTEQHWQSTPSWWTRMYMRRPQRVKLNRLTRRAIGISLEALEAFDVPNLKRKPHVYYW